MLNKLQLLDQASPETRELVALAYEQGLLKGKTQAPSLTGVEPRCGHSLEI